MTCGSLPDTGLDPPFVLLLLLGAACLVAGTAIVLLRHRRHAVIAGAAMAFVIVAASVAVIPATPSDAATAECINADNSLTITQTSTMRGLAPGTDPAAITGLLVNNGADSTYIASVVVRITSITTTRGSSTTACDPTDYRISRPRMNVDRTLPPGASAPFAGASIAFNDKPANQDACQHATIHLLYTANPD